MRKYYKIFRIDTPFVEIYNNETDMYDSYFTSESCLVQDGGGMYESEEEAERMLNDYFENFPDRAKSEEYVIVKCYKMERNKNMKYNVGNKVRIKSIDWYNENKDEYGNIELSTHFFISEMSEFCGKTLTIKDVFEDMDDTVVYYMEEVDFDWTNEMIEGLVEEVGLVDKLSSRWVNEFNLPDGYIFKDENGNVINATKIVLEKKKKEE